MTRGWFVTATGTEVGKTWVSRALIAALRGRGLSVSAVKPMETGVAPIPADARSLAEACGHPELASARGLYRVAPAVAPYAATLRGCPPPPDPPTLASTTLALRGDADALLVEGAGGLLVPLDRTHTMADLARAVGLPLLLVARDALGVLSHTLTAYECARARGLTVDAVVLNRPHAPDASDASPASNARILAERLDGVPVHTFPPCPEDDDALARAAREAGLLDPLHIAP